MSTNTFGTEAFASIDKPASPIAAGAAKAIAILFAVVRKIGQEIAYMLAQDIANGKIRREPEDWER